MTDWKMCGMSGLELCRALRSGIETRDLYLVILTMSDGQQDADLCFAAGADAYLLKGAPNDEIIRQMDVAQHIMQSRSALREPPSEK
jgi:CheY-like chemotaxis protein